MSYTYETPQPAQSRGYTGSGELLSLAADVPLDCGPARAGIWIVYDVTNEQAAFISSDGTATALGGGITATATGISATTNEDNHLVFSVVGGRLLLENTRATTIDAVLTPIVTGGSSKLQP